MLQETCGICVLKHDINLTFLLELSAKPLGEAMESKGHFPYTKIIKGIREVLFMIWINSIVDGSKFFIVLAGPVLLLMELAGWMMTRTFRPVKLILRAVFLYYLCCVFALVFLPLPSLEEAAGLIYEVELMPMHCLVDACKNPMRGTLVILFNVLMTIPFGMFLRYYFGLDAKRVFLYSLALTTLIEFGQFSGLFFLFKGSYRLFEVDDLLLNTAGGMLGYLLMGKFGRNFPDLEQTKVITARRVMKLA